MPAKPRTHAVKDDRAFVRPIAEGGREARLTPGVCTVALFALFALPGWIMVRDARAAAKGA